jgi:hypothetical protein
MDVADSQPMAEIRSIGTLLCGYVVCILHVALLLSRFAKVDNHGLTHNLRLKDYV